MNIIGMSQSEPGGRRAAPEVRDDRPPGLPGRGRSPTSSRGAAGGETTAKRRRPTPGGGARRAQGSPLRIPMVMLVIYLASLQVQANGDGALGQPAFGDCEIFGQARSPF
jgi:hypothetical protein